MSGIPEQCLPFDEDLSAWIDGELDAAREAAVRAHVGSCARCTPRVAALRGVNHSLRGLASRPHHGLAARMAERIAAERSRAAAPPSARLRGRAPRRSAAQRIAGLVAMVAAVALGLLVVPKLFPPAPIPAAPALAREPAPAPPVADSRVASNQVAQSPRPDTSKRHFGASAAEAPAGEAASAADAGLAQLREASDDDLELAAALQDAGGVDSPDDLALVERLDEVESLPPDSGGRG